MSEEWRPVVEFEGLYEVSDLGRVRGVERMVKSSRGSRRLPSKIMKGFYNRTTKYWYVALSREGDRKVTPVHVLVAGAFLGPRPIGFEVRHLNGDSLCNYLANLAYGTPSENRHDSVRHGTHGWLAKNRQPQLKGV